MTEYTRQKIQDGLYKTTYQGRIYKAEYTRQNIQDRIYKTIYTR